MPQTPKSHPGLVLGAANMGSASDPMCKTTTPEAAAELLTILQSYGYDTVDTARRYPPFAQGTSEELLGSALAILSKRNNTPANPPNIKIDTKVLSNPGDHTIPRITSSIRASLSALQLPKVHTIYAHAPDRSTPFTSAASAFHTAVTTHGQAARWGISNYTLSEVQTLLQICDENNWTRPSVYQGQYSAVARQSEALLIQYLHSQDISFYAFAPGAAGIFGSASRLQLQNAAGDAMRAAYGVDAVRRAAERVKAVAAEKGIKSAHEVAVRWVVWHSMLDAAYGDKVIVGAGSVQQLRETLDGVERGPLEPDVVEVVERVWAEIEIERENPGV
ncbi:uncharacterized protein A1O9_05460 [Exophiala aquamarina CBS 119918]|uniref:NADP-dependent oxidoreductase domain-containing protein n=1 Tax=Exophiala aquamarina CBS 119918 TaxID=1182545 RepID=A0A072PE07_9EURO|nr:uncharacterized protein A1O9_05460 [Exophiala aquamarina CBS 119918]KEF57543.1 hypothetical protein A1O9_05460 [Exophiala aquamarina CBS 119918]